MKGEPLRAPEDAGRASAAPDQDDMLSEAERGSAGACESARPGERMLCRVDEIPDPGAKGFPSAPGGFFGLFAVRKAGQVHVYVNSCPHIGVPLEPLPDRFLDARRHLIVCSAHGARFRIEDGSCVSGPCLGQHLEPVPVRIVEGWVVVPADAGK